MKKNIVKGAVRQGANVFATLSLSVLASTLIVQLPAYAGGTIKIGESKSFTVGAGLRTSLVVNKGGDDKAVDFGIESMRLYTGAQLSKELKFTFNSEIQNAAADGSQMRILDVIAQFEPAETFNVWMGRFLPPSDRSNFNGPYYLSTWEFPGVAQRYPALFAGRDDGLAVWGQTGGGQFKYQVGVFEGTEGAPNKDDAPLFSGRLTYNFWEPEPGYYNSSSYYGTKDVLAIGAVVMQQADFTRNNSGGTEDFSGWNVDFLMEKKLTDGAAVTVEGAFYGYDTNGADLVRDGESYLVSLAYLLPNKTGLGRVQPVARFQSFSPDKGDSIDQWDVGMNYIVDGHNARFSFILTESDEDQYGIFGIQLQI